MKDRTLKELEELASERAELKRLIKEYRIKERSSAKTMRKYYQTKKEEATRRLEEIDRRMRELENRAESGDFNGIQE